MLRLFGAEGLNGVDSGGAARGQVASQERGSYEAEGSGAIGDWVRGAYLKEQRRHQAHDDDGNDEPTGYADGGQRESVANKHTGEGLLLGTESHANTNFAGALGNGISDNAVDTDDAEQQRHGSGHAKHDEREGSAGHRAPVVKVESVNVGKRKIGVQGPHGLADFIQETLRARTRAANDECDFAHGHGVIALKMIHQEGPINGSRGRFADAFIVNVADDTDALAERGRGVVPILASQIFRNHGDGNFLVGIVPGDFTAGYQRRAGSVQVFGRNKSEGAERREFAPGVGVVLNEDGIMPASVGHGEHGDDSGGPDAWNRCEPAQDLFLRSDDLLILFHHGAGNGDAECLQCRGPSESGIDVGESAESANHQAGADQQDERESDLHDDKDTSRAMLLLALAERAAALADAGAEAHSGVLKDRNGTKQDAGQQGNEKREEQDAAINADFTKARKSRRSDCRKNAQRGISEAQADGAAKQA